MLEHMDVELTVKEAIQNKTVVIHPPQELLCTEDEIEDKYTKMNSGIEILFVSRDFFRKGGHLLIKSFK